ncbi:MAG: alpha/beta fold hydrolase [Colwellia sp.]|nr:alpha/beta fold hydrolase [Colwellia sp.]
MEVTVKKSLIQPIKKWVKIVFSVIVGIIVIALILGQFLNLLAKDIPPPGEIIDVGGHSLHINCTGIASDRPTIIIESGLGNSGLEYYWIQNGLEQSDHVCSYDRAGMGWSEKSDFDADSINIATQLHTLLNKSDIKRPFMFAGHSAAGLHMRVYANKYPDEVAGMVFIDAVHPDQYEEQRPYIQQYSKQATKDFVWMLSMMEVVTNLGLVRISDLFSTPFKDGFPEHISEKIHYYHDRGTILAGLRGEISAKAISSEQASKAENLGSMPLTIITTPLGEVMGRNGKAPVELDYIMTNIHDKTQQKNLLSSTKSKMVIIEGSDHMSLIFKQDHALQVVEYIKEMSAMLSQGQLGNLVK